MKRSIRLLRQLIVMLTAAASIGALAAAPVRAATFVVCDSYPAPSISASGGYFTAHYYHQCNTATGIDLMVGFIDIMHDDGDGNRANDAYVDGRAVVAVPQRTAAGTLRWPVGSRHGRYYARQELIFNGDITTGPAPHGGCGRNTVGNVHCTWYSAAIFG